MYIYQILLTACVLLLFFFLKDRCRKRKQEKKENHNIFVHLDNQPSLSYIHAQTHIEIERIIKKKKRNINQGQKKEKMKKYQDRQKAIKTTKYSHS